MQTKKYLYAAVGAQVSAVKTAQTKLSEVRTKIDEGTKSFGDDAQKRLEGWADEGETFVSRFTDGKAIDELTSKVDFDQMQTQVNKLRDQLEDLVATWRTNFRPSGSDTPSGKVEVAGDEPKQAAKKTTEAKKPAAKTTAAKKPAAKTTAAKKPAAKTESAKKAS